MAIDLCEEISIRSTFYFTANFAHEYPAHIERMLVNGQEIGCHGLNHTDEENYDRMPKELQRTYIKMAKQKLETVVGLPVCTYRSPRVKTSAHTLMLLSEYGYLTDSSVCPQRMDFVSSNLINPGWLIAPRYPYHPSEASAYRRGNLPVWEVPISAAFFAFISSSLKVFGLSLMKIFFRLLYTESRRTGKPIVYLAHPSEFIDTNNSNTRITINDFSPSRIRTHGLLIRNLLFRYKGQALFKATQQLFAYIASFPNITFMTCTEYIHYLEQTSTKMVS